MATNKYIKEVEETLRRLSTTSRTDADKWQHYLGTRLPVIGLTATMQKQACKNGFSFHSDYKEAVWKHYDAIYKGIRSHEGKSQAFLYLDMHYRYIPLHTQLQYLPAWVKEVDNWAHSDYLSKFLSRLLESPGTKTAMLKQLKQWNRSANPWERRQSLIPLFYYARTRRNHVDFKTVIRLLKPLLADTDYYVQKAVGWTLRECYNVYPADTYNFIEARCAAVSPVAFTTAIEKMTEAEKTRLKQLRKKHA